VALERKTAKKIDRKKYGKECFLGKKGFKDSS
jgi:hypothetical protein